MKRLFLLLALLLMGAASAVAATVISGGHPYNATQSTPSNPTGTTNTTGLMMGLAGAITPIATGNVHINISGTMFNATAIADGAKVQMRSGTGSAPANAAALTGTTCGGFVQYIASTTAGKVPFSLNCVVSGLTVGTAIWIDVALAAITAGTASITDLSISAQEL